MPIIATRVRPNLAVKLGLVARSRVISNDLKLLVSRIGERLGSNSDITLALEHMKARVEGKLIKGLHILLYHGDIIVVRVSAAIDWQQNEFQIATSGAHIQGSATHVTASTEQFCNAILDQFLRSITRHTKISSVRVIFDLADEAIAEHGLAETMRMARLQALTAQESEHVRSFVPIGERASFADPSLAEVTLGVDLGRSRPLGSFARPAGTRAMPRSQARGSEQRNDAVSGDAAAPVHGAWTPEGEAPPPMRVSEDAVVGALRTVFNPCIPVDVYELGLIYAVELGDDGHVRVEMTLPAPSCPHGQDLTNWVEEAVRAVPGVTDVDVEMVWDPPWDCSRMSEDARRALNMF